MDTTKPPIDLTPSFVDYIDPMNTVVDITPADVNLIEAKPEPRVLAFGKPDNRAYRRALRAHNRKAEKEAKKQQARAARKTAAEPQEENQEP